MPNPTISFCIPVYKKSPDVFRACLRSLFDQSLKRIEVICVFDGLDVPLQAVLSEFPKVQAVVIEHGGAPKARNAGLAVATGDYVVFWDADCRIKPDSAKRWLDEFEATDADFVYTGYEADVEGMAPFESEPFDRYSLECGNYICTMSPIKREKAFQWDETLEAAQDWDYWLTATEKGLKGVFIEGSAFVTHIGNDDSISIKGLSGPNRDDIIRKIRAKHGIPERSIGVFSTSYRAMAIKLAQIIGADVIKQTGLTPTEYKSIFNLGYGFLSRFDGIAPDVTKIQYWLPGEIEMLQTRSYAVVKETVKVAEGVRNICGTQYEKNRLSEYGINAELATLPLADDDVQKLATELPKEFSVLIATDEAYGKLLKDIAIDLPHVKFHYNAAKVADFSCYLAFYQFAALDTAMLVAHVNGRNVISNVAAPYCGFIDHDQNWETFKAQLYEAIRKLRTAPFNKEAQDYYIDVANPTKFRDLLKAPIKLDVLA